VVTKSKIVVIATIAALSLAGPVFAQSFNRSIVQTAPAMSCRLITTAMAACMLG
jgi:hypothetical protein